MKNKRWTRRDVVRTAAGLSAYGLSASVKANLVITPRQTEGPFYPREVDRFNDVDNDLVKLENEAREAGGTILHLSGRVRSLSGHYLDNAVVEIWQCDVNGRYIHGMDRSTTKQRDSYFQGFGRTHTNSDGKYQFRTIRPVPYPGRTPHIHLKIYGGEIPQPLTTQLYVSGEPLNQKDFLYTRLSDAERIGVTMNLESVNGDEFQGRFDIAVNT